MLIGMFIFVSRVYYIPGTITITKMDIKYDTGLTKFEYLFHLPLLRDEGANIGYN